ncbi:AraD1 family protein [Lunatibacter salilacus]|uniref:AraD1 family protein n=1 Tax=Lunatibacter salilacus TaxID=2483804 RepID=UPI00131E5445|nr:AraD1 family protein [Lunatibacter salilacus]
MRLIQFKTTENNQNVGLVDDSSIIVLEGVSSTYQLVQQTFQTGISLPDLIDQFAVGPRLDYPTLIRENRILLPLDHPDPYHAWITGTGLTHLGSASSRDAMHQKLKQSDPDEVTDSMRMFRMGLENGKMVNNTPGIQPEWFYKGNGLMAVPSGQPLPSPSFAMDGSEEPEVVGLYVNGPDGTPFRVGFALGNEFSDHTMEKINYLYLAHSKLRHCSYGPELLIGDLPNHLTGTSKIARGNEVVWEKKFLTGEANMSHNLANLEHHHFKYDLFRQPGDVHVHYFGTSVLSFADGIEVRHGDKFEINIPEFGQPLTNTLHQI